MSDRVCAGVGLSTKPVLSDALDEVWQQIKAGLDGHKPTLVLAHAGVTHRQDEVVAGLLERGGGVPVVGGSSQGVSVRGRTVESPRFLAAAGISGVEPRVAAVDDISQDAAAAGRQLADQLGSQPGAALLYYDPLGGANAQGLVDAMARGGITQIYGAATGQPWGKFVKTFQYAGDRVLERGAVALLVPGLVPVADLTHGAESIGLSMTVTKSDGNIIKELDGRPALEAWCEQLGVAPTGHVDNSANWALGVKPPGDAPYEGLITRAPFALDAELGVLILQAPIPEGSTVQVCTRSKEAVLEGAARMGDRLRQALVGTSAVLVLGFECGARPEPFLGSELAHKETCELQEIVGPDVPWLGTYAWGEIAPVGDKTYFHNFTFPLCVLTRS